MDLSELFEKAKLAEEDRRVSEELESFKAQLRRDKSYVPIEYGDELPLEIISLPWCT